MSGSNDAKSLDRFQVKQLFNALLVNACIFGAALLLFECNRGIKLIYSKRFKHKYLECNRVPSLPLRWPLHWIYETLMVNDDKFVQMVGMDGYFLLRYIRACFKFASFVTFGGLVILCPIYSSAQRKSPTSRIGWSGFTMANIPDDPYAPAFWAPAILAYIFSLYFCYLMYDEYSHFVSRRLQYLSESDEKSETPVQVGYSLMLENIPRELRSEQQLFAFFDRLFPGEIYSVELSAFTKDLDNLTNERKLTRNKLEVAIAAWKSASKSESENSSARPTLWLPKSYLQAINSPPSLEIDHQKMLCKYPLKIFVSSRQADSLFRDKSGGSKIAEVFGYLVVDAIDFYRLYLGWLNRNVEELQLSFNSRRQGSCVEDIDVAGKPKPLPLISIDSSSKGALLNSTDGDENSMQRLDIRESLAESSPAISANTIELIIQHATSFLGRVFAGIHSSFFRLKLLTAGSSSSSTGFVTLRSRVSSCNAHQILLSHTFFNMIVVSAPDPRDIIWDNLPIRDEQISIRLQLTWIILTLGIIFWSVVVSFITTLGNLSSLAEQVPALQVYVNSDFYQALNSYIASSILLIFLGLLPGIFEFISRQYEGLKLESAIQNSIFTRYFDYQLANIFVSIGLGSISSSIDSIVSNPTSILSTLGKSLPGLSFYFTTIVLTKTFTQVSLQLLQLVPLLLYHVVLRCINKKKCTRRGLSSGVFAPISLKYGLVYPDLMMVLMIMMTYMCISPWILPFVWSFFGFSYLAFKHQLLFVFESSYQSGGFMWYTVFNRSLTCLMVSIVALIAYLGIRGTFLSGPFYFLLPLPVLIHIFKVNTESKFKGPSIKLSLESAIVLDENLSKRSIRASNNASIREDAESVAIQERTGSLHLLNILGFIPTLYQQPSLVKGDVNPCSYRHLSSAQPDSPLLCSGDDGDYTADAGNRIILPDREINDQVDEILNPEADAAISLLTVYGKSQHDVHDGQNKI